MPTFNHSGDIGDLIYSLPAIKGLGGGILYLNTDGFFGTRSSVQTYEAIKPFLLRQPYIKGFELHEPGTRVFIDLNAFRMLSSTYEMATKPTTDILLDLYKLDRALRDVAWLSPYSKTHPKQKPIVINRTGRYNGSGLAWEYVLEEFDREDMLFVGHKREHDDFEEKFGPVDYCAATFDEMAQLISKASLFIGNQSSALSLAEGFKTPSIVELCSYMLVCCFNRPDSIGLMEDVEKDLYIGFTETPKSPYLSKLLNGGEATPDFGNKIGRVIKVDNYPQLYPKYQYAKYNNPEQISG